MDQTDPYQVLEIFLILWNTAAAIMASSLADGLQSLTRRATLLRVSRWGCCGHTVSTRIKWWKIPRSSIDYYRRQGWRACRSIRRVCIPWNFAYGWTLLITVCQAVWRWCVSRKLKLLSGAFAKLRKATVSFVVSVRSSVLVEQLDSHRTHFHEIWHQYFFFLEKLSIKSKLH